MKTLGIIGANGMLGSDLVSYLHKHFLVYPITKDTYASCIGDSFDFLINANGNSKRFWANEHILDDFELSTVSVYKSLVDFKFKHYVYISSSDVYEFHENAKLTQENKTPNVSKLSAYGFHKYLSEQIVMQNAPEYLILRCSMMLGKNLRKGPIHDILQNKSLFITKDSELQMITTREVANIISFLFGKKHKNDIINIGGKGTISFTNVGAIFKKSLMCLPDAKRQKYDMNIEKLSSMYALKSTSEYLQEFADDILLHQ